MDNSDTRPFAVTKITYILQVVPIDVHMLTWFSRLHCDDEDYQMLSSSPLVNVEASGQHAGKNTLIIYM